MFALQQGDCATVSSINDKNDWKTVKNALQVIDIEENNINVSSMILWFNQIIPISYFCNILKLLLCRACLTSSQVFFTWGMFSSTLTAKAMPPWTAPKSWAGSQLWARSTNECSDMYETCKVSMTIYTILPLQLLEVDAHRLHEGLTYRMIEASNDQVRSLKKNTFNFEHKVVLLFYLK